MSIYVATAGSVGIDVVRRTVDSTISPSMSGMIDDEGFLHVSRISSNRKPAKWTQAVDRKTSADWVVGVVLLHTSRDLWVDV